jgi:ABC-type multidrug transport system ATPase subunit
VSGSGKSTLIHDVLYRNLLRAKGQSSDQEPGACKSITGTHRIGDVVMVDQSPLARTPRSTPILYLGLFDQVRELFAAQPEAMAQGLTAGAFSFNSGNGRCERCSGTGYEKIEMQFLSDLYVRCAECEGKRFQPHVLKVRLYEKSIHAVLELTISEAIQFFAQSGEDCGARISDGLKVLDEVGLGYLRLGQPLNTLSGGESQRLKLVGHLAENAQRSTPNVQRPITKQSAIGNLFIFDEPTTGLHFDDVALLLQLFQRLVDRGHSVVVIEHNLEVIKCADWIVDLGPKLVMRAVKSCAPERPNKLRKRELAHRKVSRARSGRAQAARVHSWRPPGTTQIFTATMTRPLTRREEQRQVHASARALPIANERRDSCSRRARAQSQKHRSENPAGTTRGHHRVERLRQIDGRVRHPIRRGTTPVSRQHVAVCAAIRGATRKTRCRSGQRIAADRRHRATCDSWRRQIDRSRRLRRFTISSGSCSQKPERSFVPTAICLWKNRVRRPS